MMKWLSKRTKRELGFLRLLSLFIISAPLLYINASFPVFLVIGMGFLLYTGALVAEVGNDMFKLAEKHIKKMSSDVESQMEQIFQHIRGEKS